MFSAKRDSCYHWYYKLASCWVLVKMQWTSIHKNKQQLPDSLSKYLFLLIFLLERGYKESFIVFQKGLCPEETLYVNFFFFFCDGKDHRHGILRWDWFSITFSFHMLPSALNSASKTVPCSSAHSPPPCFSFTINFCFYCAPWPNCLLNTLIKITEILKI